MKFVIEWRNQFGVYQHYQTQHGRTSAYRTAELRAKQTKRFIGLWIERCLVDLFYP